MTQQSPFTRERNSKQTRRLAATHLFSRRKLDQHTSVLIWRRFAQPAWEWRDRSLSPANGIACTARTGIARYSSRADYWKVELRIFGVAGLRKAFLFLFANHFQSLSCWRTVNRGSRATLTTLTRHEILRDRGQCVSKCLKYF